MMFKYHFQQLFEEVRFDYLVQLKFINKEKIISVVHILQKPNLTAKLL